MSDPTMNGHDIAPSDPETALQHVRALRQRGETLAAIALCRTVLQMHPQCFDAIFLLGALEHQAGRLREAVRLLEESLRHQTDHAPGFVYLGNLLQSLGRHTDAITNYDRALELQPTSPDTFYNRGIALYNLQRYHEALASYDRALALRGDYAEALLNRGMALQRLQQLDSALASFDRALALNPNLAEGVYNRANVLREMGRLDEALAAYDHLLDLRPDHARAVNNRANVLRELGRHEEARSGYLHALDLQPHHPEALNNLGNLQRYLREYEQALTSYEHASSLHPEYVKAINNRALALQDMRRHDEALAGFAQALSIQPDFADAHLSEGLCRLRLGDFGTGWEKYEWRWKASTAPEARTFVQPLWLGQEHLAGETLLLHAEQGLGDTLQFCRYAAAVAARGARVILEVQPPLRSLLSRLDGPAMVLGRGEPLPDFDLQCPLLSLPLACRTTVETIPCDIPYLKADPTLIAAWRERLAGTPGPRIGLTWSGRPSHSNDHNRSLRLDQLAYLRASGRTFICLQPCVRERDRTELAARPDILQFPGKLETFDDTAALISCLDLVVTVDTAVAHLAGALGIPVWILLPYTSEWRWLIDRTDSPWYPSARLFRQADPRSWEQVIRDVAMALGNLSDP